MMNFRYEMNDYAAAGDGGEEEVGMIRVRSTEGLARLYQGGGEQLERVVAVAAAASAEVFPPSVAIAKESSPETKTETFPKKDPTHQEAEEEKAGDEEDDLLLEASGWSVVSCDEDGLDGCFPDRQYQQQGRLQGRVDSSVTLGEIELTRAHGTGADSTMSSLGASGLYTNPPSHAQQDEGVRTSEEDDDDEEPLSVPGTNSLPTDLRSLELHLHQDGDQDNLSCCDFCMRQSASSLQENKGGSVSPSPCQAKTKEATRPSPYEKRSNFSTLHLLVACVITFAITSCCFVLWDYQTWRTTARDLERVLKDREEELARHHREGDEEDGMLSPSPTSHCAPSGLSFEDENSTQAMSSISVDTCWFKGQVSVSLGSCANETAHGVIGAADYLWGWSKSFWDLKAPHATVSTGGMYSTAGVTLSSLRQIVLAVAQAIADAPTPTNLADRWYSSSASS